MGWTSRIGSNSSFLLEVFFVLTITFCLVSAGIFKANISIGIMTAYATKSEGSSGGDKSDDGGGGSKGVMVEAVVVI